MTTPLATRSRYRWYTQSAARFYVPVDTLDYYKQSAGLRFLDGGSKGLDALNAVIWQIGAKCSF